MQGLQPGFCHHLDGEGHALEEQLVEEAAVVTVEGLESSVEVCKRPDGLKCTARVAIPARQIRNSQQRYHQSGQVSDRKCSNAS